MEPTPRTPQSADPPPQPPPAQPQQPPPASSLPPPSSSLPIPSNSNPAPVAALPSSSNQIPTFNPNSNPRPPTTSLLQQQPQSQTQSQQQQPQPHLQASFQNTQTNRPPFNTRPAWSQPPTHYSHFQAHITSSSPMPSSSLPTAIPAPPRGGIAMGFPANHPTSSPAQPGSFSSSFPPQYNGLARNPVNVPESVSNSTSSAARPPSHGIQGGGIMNPQIRPNTVPAHHQQRPVQSSARPQLTSNNQPTASPSFQAHGLLRAPSVGPPGSSVAITSQGLQSQNQPWLSSGAHARPPLPSPPFRPHMNPQVMHQRPHPVQQPHHPVHNASQPQQSALPPPPPQQQQHLPPLNLQQEQYGQHLPSARIPQSLPNQQQNARVAVGNQKAPSPAIVQPSSVQATPVDRTVAVDAEFGNRILRKRSIQELVDQVDPSEKLDPEVEEVLIDLAEDFIDSITTFGCSLAKHRKSDVLEAKDILLHLERNWAISLPGFSGDEIKTYRKPSTNDAHKERLAVIKKSMSGTEVKSSGGQAGGNLKGHMTKGPSNVMGS